MKRSNELKQIYDDSLSEEKKKTFKYTSKTLRS